MRSTAKSRGTQIHLTGTGFNSCSWEPHCLLLNETSPSVYEGDLRFNSTSTNPIEFKITRGDWTKEATDGNGKPFENYRLDPVSTKAPLVFNVINWKDLPPLGVMGTVEKTANFYSPQLQNIRDVWVWLPPSYSKNLKKHYPVVYMHDGQNCFDPATSTFGVDWGIDETMTRLISAGKVREAIVVAAASTADRDREYDFSEKGDIYAQFIIKTLKPYIDSHYRTQPGRTSTFTMGSSMGATISFEMAWAYPEVFSKAAALSLPVFVTNSSIYHVLTNHPKPASPIQIYMDHGTWGEDTQYGKPAHDFYQWFQNQGYSTSKLSYQIFPYADHSEVDWSRRVHVPLEFFLAQ